jgi:hypothetical protein
VREYEGCERIEGCEIRARDGGAGDLEWRNAPRFAIGIHGASAVREGIDSSATEAGAAARDGARDASG